MNKQIQIVKQLDQIDLTVLSWFKLDNQELVQIQESFDYSYQSCTNLNINLQGDNIRCQSVLINLLNMLSKFSNTEKLDLCLGYSNELQSESFLLLLRNIFSLKKLKKLCLNFDFNVINVNNFQKEDLNCLLQDQTLIPMIYELELVIHQQKNFYIGNNVNLISLFTQYQSQIQIIRLEIIENRMSQEDLQFVKPQSTLFLSARQQKPIDICWILKKAFQRNLDIFQISLEKSMICDNQQDFFEMKNYSCKEISFHFVEIENVSNIIKQLLINLDCFPQLKKFDMQIHRIINLENLEMPAKSCLDQQSTLEILQLDILNSTISKSFIDYIYDLQVSLFNQTQQLFIHQESHKLKFEIFEQNERNFKFVYENFSKVSSSDQIQKQIEYMQKFCQQKFNLKKLNLQLCYSKCDTFIGKGSVIQEMNIYQISTQKNIEDLSSFLDTIDKNELKSVTLELCPFNQELELDFEKLQNSLKNFKELTYYS